MIKHFVFSVFFILAAACCNAQLIYSLDDDKSYVANTEAKLASSVTDSAKGYLSFKLYVLCKLINDTSKSKFYYDKAVALSQSHPFLNAISYYYKAHTLYTSGNIPAIEANLMKGDSLLSAFTHKDAYEFRAHVWHAYSTFKQIMADEKSAMDGFLNKALPYAEKSGNLFLVGNIKKSIATVFMNAQQPELATVYLLDAGTNISASPEDNPTRLETLSETYIYTAENFVRLLKYDSAKIYLDKVKIILINSPKSNLNLPYFYAEGIYFDGISDYKNAIISFDKGILLGKDYGSKVGYTLNRLKNGKLKSLYQSKNYTEAISVTTELLKDPLAFEHDRQDLYKYLYKSYAALGNRKDAFMWSEKYIELKDSLHKKEVAVGIADVEKKYTAAEKEKKIIQLQLEKETAILNKKNSRLIIISLSIATLLLLSLSILGFRLSRNAKKLSAQKEITYLQQLNEVKSQQQLELTQALLQGEEKERKRLAGDLHDGLGGMLAGVKINLSRMLKYNSQEIFSNDLPRVIKQLDNSVNELRRIAKNMMPETLMNSGLEVALKDMCESLLSDKTKIDFQALRIQSDIPQETQVTIYRIVQELLANAIRHANPKNILVQCSQNKNRFFITVEDDGKGFDKNDTANNGIGLVNVKNRVNFLEGHFEIHSNIGDGTTINIEFNVTK